MAEVGVHLDDDRCTRLERDAEPVEVRATQTLLRRSVPNADPLIGRGETVGDRPGAVRRIVVDDEDASLRERREDGRRDRADIVGLVIRRLP
jgi:hypothetical protein